MDLSQIIVDGKLQIRYWDDPVLSEICDPVREDEFGEKLENFGNLVLETISGATQTNNKIQPGTGIGLAANQVGLAKRIFVMFRVNRDLPPIIAVNPVITDTYGPPIPHREGCLSIPDVWEQVKRPSICFLRYQHPRTGEWNEVELGNGEGNSDDSFDSYCAQHEVDHLDGIMFFDRRRMEKNLSKHCLRTWDKIKSKYLR